MRINKQQLVQLNKFLLSRGYQQCDSPYKEEDYSYWKSFRSTSSSLSDYQIAIHIVVASLAKSICLLSKLFAFHSG